MLRHAAVISLSLAWPGCVLAFTSLPEADRQKAKAEIEALQKEGKLDDIRALLKDADAKKRGAAAWAVVDLKIPGLAADMEALFKDPEEYLRCEGAYYLCTTDLEGYAPRMTEALADKNKCVRTEAVHYLGRRGSEEQKQAATALQADPELSVRQAVASSFPMPRLSQEEKKAAENVVKALRDEGNWGELRSRLKSKNRRERSAAVYGLNYIGNPKLAKEVAALLEDAEPGIRADAAYHLAQWAGKGHNESMAKALKDQNPHVRVEAVFYLARHGSEAQKAAAKALSEDKDQKVREAVTSAFAPRASLPPSAADCADAELLLMTDTKPVVETGIMRKEQRRNRKGDLYDVYALERSGGGTVTLLDGSEEDLLKKHVGDRVRVSGCLTTDEKELAIMDLAETD